MTQDTLEQKGNKPTSRFWDSVEQNHNPQTENTKNSDNLPRSGKPTRTIPREFIWLIKEITKESATPKEQHLLTFRLVLWINSKKGTGQIQSPWENFKA